MILLSSGVLFLMHVLQHNVIYTMSQLDYQDCTVMHECAVDYSIYNNIIMYAAHVNAVQLDTNIILITQCTVRSYYL